VVKSPDLVEIESRGSHRGIFWELPESEGDTVAAFNQQSLQSEIFVPIKANENNGGILVNQECGEEKFVCIGIPSVPLYRRSLRFTIVS
jgi:hypothetical protein